MILIECFDMCSAVLAHILLNEKLQRMGMLGCLLCIVGSTMIVLHAPEERSLSSVEEIWELAIQPGMLLNVVKLSWCSHFLSPILISSFFLPSSISFVYSLSSSCCISTDFILCTPLWPNQYNGLYRHLLCNWIIDSKLLYIIANCLLRWTYIFCFCLYFAFQPCALNVILLIFSLTFYDFIFCFVFHFVGHEYKSHWHCNKTYIRGNKPANILPDMDFCNGCYQLYHHSVKLFKHGQSLIGPNISLNQISALSCLIVQQGSFVPVFALILPYSFFFDL